MKMACVRNFLLSMLYLLAFGRYSCGLSVSLQNLDLGINRSDVYPGQSSNASVPSQNLTLPPNPFVFESVAGYTAVYTITGRSTFGHGIATRLMIFAMAELERQRRVQREEITGPIPGSKFLVTKRGQGCVLTWTIDQEGVRTTQNLSYEHAEIALQGTQDVVRQYDTLVRQYDFSLYKTHRLELVAKGQLKRLQDRVTN